MPISRRTIRKGKTYSEYGVEIEALESQAVFETFRNSRKFETTRRIPIWSM